MIFRPLTLAALLAAPAAAAPPSVEGVAPGVGQRGTTFTATLTGARLGDPKELLLYAPGVTCTKLTAKGDTEVSLTLTAAPDCRLGEHPFRLRAAGGVSELRTLTVTPLPVVAEAEPNDTPAQAKLVPLGTTVTGVIESADVDHFKVALKKGQRLSAEVQAIRLGGELLDAVLTVTGPDGRELAAVDDTPLFRQDPFVSLVAPAAGEYTLRVRDTALGGGAAYRYALHVGDFPRPAGVFPVGGPAGQDVPLQFLGEAGGMTAKLPAGGPWLDLFPAAGPSAAPTPQPFRVSPFPNVLEAEPNDTPAQATAAAGWPVAFNGIIQRPGDVDHYRLPAKAGETVQVEAFAYRVGSPLDSVVSVFDAAGGLLARGDDDASPDSRLTFTAPAAGDYTVRVEDKRKAGGPLFAYRLEVTKPGPSLAVFLPAPARKSQDRQTISVPRGGRAVAFLAVRRDGFDAPVTVTAAGLPAGVTMDPVTVPAGEYLVPVLLTASAGAADGGGLVGLTGTGGGVTGGFRQVVDLIQGPGDSAFHSVTVDRLAVAVVEPSPVALTLTPPAGPLAVDGATELAVTVRRGDFAGPVEVTLPFLPPGVEPAGPAVIPADQSAGTIRLTCRPDGPPGEWAVFAEAKAVAAAREARDPNAVGMNGLGTPGATRRPRRRADGFAPIPSQLVTLRVAPTPVAGKFVAAAAEAGKMSAVVVELAAPLPAGFTAKLDGLPPRVTAPPVAVAGTRIEFELTAEPTAPTGDVPTLVCELTGRVAGQPTTYRVGRGAVLRVQPAGGPAVGPDGKPLSPLDVLRKKKPG